MRGRGVFVWVAVLGVVIAVNWRVIAEKLGYWGQSLDKGSVLLLGTAGLLAVQVSAVLFFFVLDGDPCSFLPGQAQAVGVAGGWAARVRGHVQEAKRLLVEAQKLNDANNRRGTGGDAATTHAANPVAENAPGPPPQKRKSALSKAVEALAEQTWKSKEWTLLRRATVEFASWRALLPHSLCAAAIVVSGTSQNVAESKLVDFAVSGISARARGEAAPQRVLALLVGGYLFSRIGNVLSFFFNNLLREQSSWTVHSSFRLRVQAAILSQDLNYHQRQRPGDLKKILDEDAEKIFNGVRSFYFVLVRVGLRVIVCGYVALSTDAPLLVALVVARLLLFLFVSPRARIERSERITALFDDREKSLSSAVGEILNPKAMKLVQSFGAAGAELTQLRKRLVDEIGCHRSLRIIEYYGYSLSWIFTNVLDAGFFVVAMMRIQDGTMSGGDFMLLGQTIMTLVESFDYFASLQTKLSAFTPAAARTFQLLDRVPDIRTNTDNVVRRTGTSSGDISFKNVSFSYPAIDNEEPKSVLSDVSFDVSPGNVVALCGSSGAGKSTIASLMMRLYDVTSGSITMDGTDIRHLELDWLRRQFGFIEQDPTIFDRTVRENIGIGQGRSADLTTIKEAAQLANAHEFIMQLPDGYDTKLGEDGVLLSGGQRQRIAIARACLGARPILIMDEATSSLDAENEALVQESLNRVAAQRTTIIIAHRLNTIRQAQRILVVEGGRIVESGSHEELLALGEKGRYQALVTKQLEQSG